MLKATFETDTGRLLRIMAPEDLDTLIAAPSVNIGDEIQNDIFQRLLNGAPNVNLVDGRGNVNNRYWADGRVELPHPAGK